MCEEALNGWLDDMKDAGRVAHYGDQLKELLPQHQRNNACWSRSMP